MNKDFVEQAREYAKRDEYHVTRNYINKLCDEIIRLRELNKDVFSRIQNNRATWENSERYLWLRNSAWDVGFDDVAPIVVNCDNKMLEFEWLEGYNLDRCIDEWRNK